MITCIFHLPHSNKTITSDNVQKCWKIFKDDYVDFPNTLAVIREVTVIDENLKNVPKFKQTYNYDNFASKFLK
tara:strand:+ start:82 stop:300 length:219 start_codon:yes stop_codon:yes gene_type:complete